MWMENEARAVGLSFKARSTETTWNARELEEFPTESMSPVWRVFEYLPLVAWRSFDIPWTNRYAIKSIQNMVSSGLQSNFSYSPRFRVPTLSFLPGSVLEVPPSVRRAWSVFWPVSIVFVILGVLLRHPFWSLLCIAMLAYYYAYVNASEEKKTM